jgi:hypothetical protein
LARWARFRVTCGAPAWFLGEVGFVAGRRWLAKSCFFYFLASAASARILGAHVAGFAMGCVMDFILGPSADRLKKSPCVQRVSGARACGLFFLAWLLALHSAG